MLLLICSDNQACSVESFCHGRRLKRQICAGKSTANSKQPAHLLSRLFHRDGGGWVVWEKEGKEGMDQVHVGRGQGERRRHRTLLVRSSPLFPSQPNRATLRQRLHPQRMPRALAAPPSPPSPRARRSALRRPFVAASALLLPASLCQTSGSGGSSSRSCCCCSR